MSNQQLPHDVNVKKDRISPREVAEQNKAAMRQQEAETQHLPQQDREWAPPRNKDQDDRQD